LEVRNVGSYRAEEIVVKISGNITNYKVIKYISSDRVQAFIEQQPAEFVYRALPPQAGFKIIFISSNVVNPSDISVSHSTGQAIDALSVSNRSSTYAIAGIYALLFGGYLLWMVIGLRDVSFSSWKSETKGKRIDQALKPSKPWYVSDSKWATTHVDVIRELLREEYVPQEKIANCAAYGILNKEKPDHFSDSDWKELNDLAVNRLKDHLSRSIDSYSESSILNVIRLSKPERFPKDDWNTIQTNANEKFIERNKGKLYGKASMVELLHREKPEAIPDGTWQTLQNFCRKSYFDELIYEIDIREEPKSVIEKNDLEILNPQQQTKLNEIVQEKSRYKDYSQIMKSLLRGSEIPDEQLDTLSGWEWDQIKDLKDLIARTKDYSAIIESLLQGREIPAEKPSPLKDWEWDEIKKIEALLVQMKEIKIKEYELEQQEFELQKKQTDVLSEQTTYSRLKSKVLKQLEFINSVLNDPGTMERVESYDDTFSSGNWSNLKQIALLLNSRKAG
jgi:hypothetical protein